MTRASLAAEGTLRLVWPQWQGAGSAAVRDLASEFPFPVARRGYSVGTQVLQAILPPHSGPTAVVPVPMSDEGLDEVGGIEARPVVLAQLKAALALIAEHQPERILTLGGDCSVSVAPFAWLAARYGHDLAVVWIDSHPDVDTNASDYAGYHAMAVTTLLGHGDPDFHAQLPATLTGDRIALAGLHAWTDDVIGNVTQWGLASFAPDDLRDSSQPLLEWLGRTGCGKVAIHVDVDTVDSNEIASGWAPNPTGSAATRFVAW